MEGQNYTLTFHNSQKSEKVIKKEKKVAKSAEKNRYKLHERS